MAGELVPGDCGMAARLGPKARLISAWGIARGWFEDATLALTAEIEPL